MSRDRCQRLRNDVKVGDLSETALCSRIHNVWRNWRTQASELSNNEHPHLGSVCCYTFVVLYYEICCAMGTAGGSLTMLLELLTHRRS